MEKSLDDTVTGLFSCYATRDKTELRDITVLICEYFRASETGGNEVSVSGTLP